MVLALMHAMQMFEQNGTRELSNKGTPTPLDSTTIYLIKPGISHPLTPYDRQK